MKSMHMAPRAAAWVAWAVWTCNSNRRGRRAAVAGFSRERAGFGPLFFLVVRPAGRTHWGGGGWAYVEELPPERRGLPPGPVFLQDDCLIQGVTVLQKLYLSALLMSVPVSVWAEG